MQRPRGDRATEFTCQACGGTFGKLRSDAEALREVGRDALAHPAGLAVICDDCFKRLQLGQAPPP